MPLDLSTLLRPEHTAIVTVECQRGVLGPESSLPALVDAVAAIGLVPHVAGLLAAARAAGTHVVHGVALKRSDGGGKTLNCRLFAATARRAGGPLLGTPAAELVSEFGPDPRDYVVGRYHGVSLFHDSELDSILRSLGVRTVVLVGVSLNIAVTGTTIEAVNRGYQVILPRDGVVATPVEYGASILEHTLSMLATISDCETIARTLRQNAAA